MEIVLFYCSINSEYPVQIRLARLLKQQKIAEPIFCFDATGHNLWNEVEKAKIEGFKVIELVKSEQRKQEDNFLTRLRQLPDENNTHPVKTRFIIFDFVKLKEQAINRVQFFEYFLRKHKIKLVIVSCNSGGYNSSWLIKAAHNLKLKVTALPFGMGSPDTLARKLYYSVKKRKYRPMNFITGLMFPQWVHKFQGKRFLYSSPSSIWIQELLDMAPYRPWSHNGGQADYVLVESPFMMEYNLQQKLDPDRLILTGALYDDTIYRVMQDKEKQYKKLCVNYGFQSNHPLIVISIPPLMKSALLSPVSEYQYQEEALKEFLQPLSLYTGTYNVLLSIHPRLRRETVMNHVPEGIKIATEPLENIIALGSLFINCQSTTCRMALSAGVPCLDYDFYRFRFTCFNRAKGLKRVESKKEYIQTLYDWLERGELQGMRQLAMEDSDYFGISDGENHKRILEVILKFMSNHEVQETI